MKKLGKIFLFIFLMFGLSKIFVLFTAYQTINTIKEQFQNDFLLTYRWISTSLDGTVTFEGIEFTPYALKNTYSIEELNLHYSNYLSMVLNLGDFSQGQVSQLERLSLPSIRAELKGNSVRHLLTEHFGYSWFTPVSLYGCGPIETITTKEYADMGLTNWEGALDISVESISSNTEKVVFSLDQKELGKLNLQAEWPLNSLNRLLQTKTLSELKLYSLVLEHQDSGWFRRLNILCNKQGAKKRSLFSAQAAVEWKSAMYKQGLLVNAELVEAYGLYLLQGGTFKLSGQRDEGFELGKYTDLVNKDLMSYFNARIQVNGRQFERGQMWADGSIMYPPAIEKSIKQMSERTQPVFVPGYRVIDKDQLSLHQGKKFRVTMLNEKDYEGVLESLTDYNVTLSQTMPGGVVQYPLMLNEIKIVEVWLNQAP